MKLTKPLNQRSQTTEPTKSSLPVSKNHYPFTTYFVHLNLSIRKIASKILKGEGSGESASPIHFQPCLHGFVFEPPPLPAGCPLSLRTFRLSSAPSDSSCFFFPPLSETAYKYQYKYMLFQFCFAVLTSDTNLQVRSPREASSNNYTLRFLLVLCARLATTARSRSIVTVPRRI